LTTKDYQFNYMCSFFISLIHHTYTCAINRSVIICLQHSQTATIDNDTQCENIYDNNKCFMVIIKLKSCEQHKKEKCLKVKITKNTHDIM